MKRSETIINLTVALAQAQGAFRPAAKSRVNPHLKNKYATLDDVIAAVREPLQKNGLSFIQPLTGDGEEYLLETILFHESGEWIGCETVVPNSAGIPGASALQAFGGALTYMRRYSLTALLGISSDEDGDGNGKKPVQKKVPAKQKAPPKKAPVPQAQNATVPKWVDDPDVTKRFYTWFGKQHWHDGVQITKGEMYKIIGVRSSLKEYTGTPAEVKQAITSVIAAKKKAAQEASDN